MKRLFLIVLVLLLIIPVSADTLIKIADADGQMYQTSTSADWSTLINGAGTAVSTASAYVSSTLTHASTEDKYLRSTKEGYTFNTSLPVGSTVTSAVIRLKYASKTVVLGGTSEVAITNGSPANPLVYVAGDFNNFLLGSSTEFANRVDYSGISSGNINFTLNAAGISYINKSGLTVFYVLDGDEIDGTFSGTWSAGTGRQLRVSQLSDATEANRPYITIEYTPAAGGDTTPPDSITGLTNTTTNCNNITWGWTNPTTADFNHTMIWRNNTFWTNVSNITTTAFWDGLPENTAMTFSSRTCDFIPNCNLTFVNATKTTNFCPVAAPTPTPTPTATPTPAPTPALAGCLYYNLTGVYEGLNSSNWTATEGLTTWGVMTTNATQGNTSWWVCIATPTPTPTLPPWQPDINPTTDTHYNWWKLLTDWWWLPLLILAMIILFTRR